MLRQIMSPLGAVFTMELTDAVALLLTDTDEQERLQRIRYLEKVVGAADRKDPKASSDQHTRSH